jgi:hypothetical protein
MIYDDEKSDTEICILVREGRHWIEVSSSFPSSEEGNRPSSRNVMFSRYLEFRMIGEAQKPSDSECYWL